MCDLRTFNRIESILEGKMAAGQMFTAFDVTLALQKKRMRKLHREIRRDIRRVADNLMWCFGYERTLVRFEEILASAFVYHPHGTDANLHRPSIRPRTLASADSQKLTPFTKPRVHHKADQNRQDDSSIPAGTAQVQGLSLEGKTGVVVSVVPGLFIIIKHSDLDLN
jgi:hypothetical protein